MTFKGWSLGILRLVKPNFRVLLMLRFVKPNFRVLWALRLVKPYVRVLWLLNKIVVRVAIVWDKIAAIMIVALHLQFCWVNLVDGHEKVLTIDLDSHFMFVVLSNRHLLLILEADSAILRLLLFADLLLMVVQIVLGYEIVMWVTVIRN